MSGNPVGWFEIYVQDMPRARAFYEKVLGAKLHKLDSDVLEMWAFPQEPSQHGAPGALAHMPGMPSGGNSTIVYFRCDDCAQEAARAVEAGGKLMKGKFSIGQYGFIVLAYDLDGNLFGLHSMK